MKHIEEGREQKGTEQGNGAQEPSRSPNFGALSGAQNMPSVVVELDDKPHVREPSLPIIGYRLSRMVLFIISAFILALLIFLFVRQFDASASISIPAQVNIPDSTYDKKLELIRLMQEEKKNFRDFTLSIAQMILLNLLLPVLTAILGYIFASNRNRD